MASISGGLLNYDERAGDRPVGRMWNSTGFRSSASNLSSRTFRPAGALIFRASSDLALGLRKLFL